MRKNEKRKMKEEAESKSESNPAYPMPEGDLALLTAKQTTSKKQNGTTINHERRGMPSAVCESQTGNTIISSLNSI